MTPQEVEELLAAFQKQSLENAALRSDVAALHSDNAALQSESAEKDKRLRKTTLDEFLEACHKHLFIPVQVEQDPNLTSRGPTTSPKGRACPKTLQPWTDFQRSQRRIHREIRSALCHTRHFPVLVDIEGNGERIQKRLSSEADLRIYAEMGVLQFLRDAIGHLCSFAGFKDTLGDGFEFHNHSHALQDGEPEVEAAKNTKAATRRVPKPANADQFCVRRIDDKARLVFVIEYKAPHKLTLQFLQAALGGPLDLHEIRNRLMEPLDKDDKFIEDAEMLVAAAATQTYQYMLEGGLAYGCLVTGEAILFLHIKKQNPQHLYYHLAVPGEQVGGAENSRPNYSLTAISQLMNFCVLASRMPQYNADWRTKTMEEADKWELDYDTLERELKTPRRERRQSPEHSAYKGRVASRYRDFKTRAKKDDDDDDDEKHGDNPPNNEHGSQSPANSSSDEPDAETPSRSRGTGGNSNTTSRSQGAQGSTVGDAEQPLSYCTQLCLRGLAHGLKVDETCPNAALHPRKTGESSRHLIGAKKFTTLVRTQLGTALSKNCTNLQINGARGMLFRVTLESHGYVLVGKGTIEVFIPDLEHEARVYKRLRTLQGTRIPVYLGSIDLILKWWEPGICIQHMLLMSYGGSSIGSLEPELKPQVSDFESELAHLGVQHLDLYTRNMLWNEDAQRLIFIDFERSAILPRPKDKKTSTRVLQELSPDKGGPNKRLSVRTSTSAIDKGHSWGDGKVKQMSTSIPIFDENLILELPAFEAQLQSAQQDGTSMKSVPEVLS
ncbi:MAG: hypothetical protein Q9219_007620 [cf. Caloplaca sp. 3 TL-2023]